MCITGVCGAGKSTLGRAWSHQAQLPVHRRDDDLDCRQLVEPELPDVSWWTDPQRYARCSFAEVACNHVSRRLQQACSEGHLMAVSRTVTAWSLGSLLQSKHAPACE